MPKDDKKVTKPRGLIAILSEQDFGPEDSMLASSMMHPMHAMSRMADFMRDRVDTGMGRSHMPDDEASIYSEAPLDISRLGAARDVAGMANAGGMPFAPGRSAAMLGTVTAPGSVMQMRKMMVDKAASSMSPAFMRKVNAYFDQMLPDVPVREIMRRYGKEVGKR